MPLSRGIRTATRFQPVEDTDIHRLVASAAGEEKSGKNHFAFTAPGPIGVLSMDTGMEGMVRKFLHPPYNKKISKTEYKLTVQPGDGSVQHVAEAANKVWTQFVSDYRDAIRTFKTTVIDTGTEEWELIRLARFGKLLQVMPHHYGPVNAEFRELLREVFDTSNNLILLHKMKDEWENKIVNGKEVGNRTGRKEVKQMNDIPFLVQVNVQCWKEALGPFHVTVTDCRQNPDLEGLDLEQPNCSFKDLAMLVYPESEEEEWL